MTPRKDTTRREGRSHETADPSPHGEVGTTEEALPEERALEVELEEARAEAERNLEAAKHWQAEFENFRRRQTVLAEDQSLRANERLVQRLLPVIDDLERTIDHVVAGGDLSYLLTGVEMVHKHVIDVLSHEGTTVIDPLGEEFDPHSQQAVSQREDPEVPEHTVIEVLQKGYRAHGRVLRPAMVVVSSGGPAQAPPKE